MTSQNTIGGTKVIGVLGGIGPEATGDFYIKLFRRLQQDGTIKKNTDYPQVVINSIPAPELIYEYIKDDELRPYIRGLKQLDEFGVDIIVMVCNTIHLYYKQLQEVVATPILNLKEELRKKLEHEGIKKISIIGTPNTIRQGLYRFDGIETIDPSNVDIKALSNAIHNFNIGKDKDKQREITEEIATRYLVQGAEKIVLGCTEFAVMLENSNLPKINTIDVLVDSVACRYLAGK